LEISLLSAHFFIRVVLLIWETLTANTNSMTRDQSQQLVQESGEDLLKLLTQLLNIFTVGKARSVVLPLTTSSLMTMSVPRNDWVTFAG